MAKSKGSQSNTKTTFGKRKKGRSVKSFNKHNKKDKQRYGY